MSNNVDEVRAALARAVATRKVPDEMIDRAAKQLASVKQQIRGIDVCTHGICIDYIIDQKEWWRVVPEVSILDAARLRGIEIFPYGIPFPDLVHVRVQQSFEGLAQAGG